MRVSRLRMTSLATARLRLLAVAVISTILLVVLLPARPAHAVTFIVTTTTDAPHSLPVDGNCTSTLPGNTCTLRAAVQAANFLTGGPHTINLQAAGTYTLTVVGSREDFGATGDLDINNVGVSIVNASGGLVVIDGNGTDRVFDVGPLAPAQLSLSGLTIQHGVAAPDNAGGIRVPNTSQLILANIVMQANSDTALQNIGRAILSNVTFSNNTGGVGGAIQNAGTMTIDTGTFTGNSATMSGGAIIISGLSSVVMNRVSMSGNNAAAGNGGAIQSFGILQLSESTIDGNAAGGSGGGLAGLGTVTNTLISNNQAGLDGGGIHGDDIGLTNVTVANNRAARHGGGISANGQFAIQLNAVTVSGNLATSGSGGGIFAATDVLVSNSTISGNAAPVGQGGGIFNQRNSTLTNVTLSGNSASTGTGGAISNNLSLSIMNTIVANSPVGGNCAGAVGVSSQGDNLSSDGTCGLGGPGDRSNLAPLLGPLSNNGGFTETHALLPGSPAINAVTHNACPPPGTDQRGFVRPAGPACDIGAFEFGAALATPTPTSMPTLTRTPVISSVTPTITPTRTITPTPTTTGTAGPSPTATATAQGTQPPTATSTPVGPQTPTPTRTPIAAGTSFHALVQSVNVATSAVVLGPILGGPCPRPIANCLELTVVASGLTVTGTVQGVAGGSTLTLQIPVADGAGNPAGLRTVSCGPADNTRTATCSATVSGAGLFPLAGGTITVSTTAGASPGGATGGAALPTAPVNAPLLPPLPALISPPPVGPVLPPLPAPLVDPGGAIPFPDLRPTATPIASGERLGALQDRIAALEARLAESDAARERAERDARVDRDERQRLEALLRELRDQLPVLLEELLNSRGSAPLPATAPSPADAGPSDSP